MAYIVSLRWNFLGWFFLNLVVILGALLGFLYLEFGLGAASVLNGSTGARLEELARPLAEELRHLPPNDWDEVLSRKVNFRLPAGEVHAGIVDSQCRVVAGNLPPMPPEVIRLLSRPQPGTDNSPRPVPRPDTGGGAGGIDKFMLSSSNPRLYWVGVYLRESGSRTPDGPLHFGTLVLASASLHGGGIRFNYTPWLLLGGGLLLVSICLWLPFLRRLTGGLADMTRAAERIAEGRFQPPRVSARDDELGRLGRALANMASRLEGHVNGQKRFLGDTAHELLSPLARLEVALSILEQRGGDADPSMVERSLGEVRHLASIVQDLLLFTKSEMRAAPVVLTTISLGALARSVARREAVGEVKVKVDIEEDLYALADRDLLDRALSNAVRNAVRYAGHAGPITVFAASAEHAPTEVRLTVLDEGPGAPEATLKKLFDPFFRPDTARTRETGGTGLGLAIVKSCIEACGGGVTASNRTVKGLAVTFSLKRGVRGHAV